MDIIKILQEELGIRRGQVETTIKLIDEGNTIPFIARSVSYTHLTLPTKLEV